MIMLIFATYFLTVVSERQATDEFDPKLTLFFGSLPVALLRLFQMTTGGFDWKELSDLLEEFSTTSVVMLCLYISMMEYAILNILTGICCNTANRTAEEDFDITMHEEQSRQENATSKLTEYFHDNDESGNGQITWEQLDGHLNSPDIVSCFKRLELERWHLRSFFRLLDTKDD